MTFASFSCQTAYGEEVIQEKNTNYNIQKAKLLKNYVDSLEKEIQKYKENHYIKSEALDSRAFDLRIMSTSLQKIQIFTIEKSEAETVIQDIIDTLKIKKQEVKILLKAELEKSQQELLLLQEKRFKSAQKISKRFIRFINVFTPKIRKLSNSPQKKAILTALTNINIEASKLALLETKEYNSKKQLEDLYSNSIRAIKRELGTIKAIIIN